MVSKHSVGHVNAVFIISPDTALILRSTSSLLIRNLYYFFQIGLKTCLLYGIKYGHEYVGVIVGPFVLYDGHKALKAHATIDVFLGQRPQGAIALSVELNEHKVPYFQHIRVIFVDKMSCLSTSDSIKVELRARTARSCFAHFPEVVLHAAWENV